MRCLSLLVMIGVGPATYAQAPFAESLAKAQKGDAEAQYQVGRAYSEGKEIGKDQAASFDWFLKAAERDHVKAQVSLGSIYSHGFGVKQDWAESLRWFRKAAFQGDRVAMHNLGLDYEHAHGVPRDFDEAAHWYRLGAELGQPRCQYNLGLLHETGKGVPPSDFEACVLFTLASRHDNQVHIFGDAKAKEVVARRDRLAEKLGADQKAKLELAVKAFQSRVAVHPRQFGAPGGGVGLTRGWYIWHRFDPETWEAEVSHDPPQEMYKVRVLPWATTYRLLHYGTRPDQLVPGERVNIFFNPDEQAGALKPGQRVRLAASSQGFVPQGETIQAKLITRKNRGAYGSGVSDLMLDLARPEDAKTLRSWRAQPAVHLLSD